MLRHRRHAVKPLEEDVGWQDDVFPWIGQFTRAWVQRRSILHARPTRSGIRITLDTKDDRGYYHYVFEVFLNRGASKATRRKRPQE